MSAVCLIPLGVGEAFAARHYTTCLALGVDDDWLLIECPHPIRKMLREATTAAGRPFDLDRVRGVAVSHLHADHACGLEDFGFYSYFALGRRATVLAHPDVSARLWDGLLAAGMDTTRVGPGTPPIARRLDDYFDVISLCKTSPVVFGPFAVECRPTFHPIPTTAFRIRVAGRTVGFSADTAFDPALIDWLDAADLIVHEATTNDLTGVHTPYSRLATLPESLRRKMRLIHYPDGFEDEPRAIEPLHQGRCYEV
ncbi:MAG: MBL fold metallo-hydrolase [Isosphaeraceae bacterium]|nr:MBL fold metallo-hydrolase [Isosphaeraceae bacterium]